MPKIEYVKKRFSSSSQDIIEHANDIIEEYLNQGFRLTLRQLYYQFVSRALIPNNQREYKRLGSIINDARLAGLIDWEAIEDRTRNLRSLAHWKSPKEIINACQEQYRIDKWEGQFYRVECWIEKDALVGVIENICNQYDVPYFSCRGYTSQSEMWEASIRLHKYISAGQTPVILHFGDHDPSGIDMTRDITDRLKLFMGGMEIRRLALNADQIDEFNPPPNPAKPDDSRYKVYVKNFGSNCWELDALEPQTIVNLIESEISELRDNDMWNESVEKENNEKNKILELSDSLE